MLASTLLADETTMLCRYYNAAEGGEKIRIMHCNKPPPEAEIFGARITGFSDFGSSERGGGGVVSRIKRIRVNTQKLSG